MSETRQASKYVGWYVGVVAVLIFFGLGVIVGRSAPMVKPTTSFPDLPEISKVTNINRNTTRSEAADFNQFWEVWDLIKQKYVKQPVKDADLFYGAMQGLVYGLSDPYSMFFPPKPAQEFVKSLSGEFSGIGAEIGMKQGQIVVVAPLPGSPASEAGLRPGDKIISIDKKTTAGMDVSTAVEHIRGPAGTTTTLFIGRNGNAKPFDVTIKRATINIPAVMLSEKPGNIAYLRLMQFNDATKTDLDRAIKEMLRRRPSGIILDLRNNPGGFLESAVDVASEWIEDGLIVSEKFSDGRENRHPTRFSHRLKGIPTVVLVNGGSASASEIVAGALQDTKSATVIGEKTFGKGSVQDFQSFPDGSALKLTVAEWFTPNGNNINEKGITPDIAVSEDYEKEKVGEDVMIEKALEVLSKNKK